MLDDVLEATVKYLDDFNSSIFVTVLHAKVVIATAGDNMEVEVGNALQAFVRADIMPLLNTRITFDSVLVQRIRPLPRTAGYYISGAATLGGIIGDMLPPQCSAVYRKLTGFAGRRYRGRIYQPGFSESDQNAGNWAGGGNAALAFSEWSDFLTTPVVGAGSDEAVWIVCDKTGAEPTSPILTMRFDPLVRTQRRRVRGVGS